MANAQRLHAWTADREWILAGDSVEQIKAALDTLEVDAWTDVTIETKDGTIIARHVIGA